MSKHNHYFFDVSKYERVDIYRLIEIIGITCPVAQHVFKKAAAAGQRGHKDLRLDWQNIMDSAARKLEMIDEDSAQPEPEDADSLWQEGEKRMDNIAASHGDGEHYGNEWIEWGGGDCPVQATSTVEVKRRNGDRVINVAGNIPWHNHCAWRDITSYRIIACQT